MSNDLGDPDETRSFLVPAYAFERKSRAQDFDLDRGKHLGPVNGPEDIYQPIHRDERRFRPLASSNFLLNASALYNPSVGQSDRPFFVRLQETASERPGGVRSSCLTVEGRRLSPKRDGGRSELVPSYAAWQTLKGGEPSWISRSAYSLDDGQAGRIASKTVASHWSGQGALCAITPDRQVHLLLVEFRVFDEDSDRGDLLKIWTSRHTLAGADMPERDPIGGPLRQAWRNLILRTLHGYSEECGA